MILLYKAEKSPKKKHKKSCSKTSKRNAETRNHRSNKEKVGIKARKEDNHTRDLSYYVQVLALSFHLIPTLSLWL